MDRPDSRSAKMGLSPSGVPPGGAAQESLDRMKPDIVNALTIDVEDYFQVSAFESHVRREDWDRWESRVVANTRRLLEMLGRRGVKATFFVLGWVAEHHPELVREIHAGGHKIGSHGHWHRLIYRQSPQEFREDLRRSRDVLQEAIGRPVSAYRAASFSITEKSLWALEILVEEGFSVDSSIFPIHHDRYGIPGTPPRLHRRTTPVGESLGVPSFGREAGVAQRAGERGRLLPAVSVRLEATTVSAASTGGPKSRSSSMFIRGKSILGSLECPRDRASLASGITSGSRGTRTRWNACCGPSASDDCATSSSRTRRAARRFPARTSKRQRSSGDS